MRTPKVVLEERAPGVVEPGTVEASIGHTPLLRLRLIGTDVPVFAKAEHLNPGGSVKDRPALSMILEGERSGRLKHGMTILDAPSSSRASSPPRNQVDISTRTSTTTTRTGWLTTKRPPRKSGIRRAAVLLI